MLYSLIGILYTSLPPEHALQFWGATPLGESHGWSYLEVREVSAEKLPSLLQWAVWSTQVRDVNMTMALYDMLSGLAKGQQCSEVAYNFLARGGGKVVPGSSLPSSTGSYNTGPLISWPTIFSLLESWAFPLRVPLRTSFFSNPSPHHLVDLAPLLLHNLPTHLFINLINIFTTHQRSYFSHNPSSAFSPPWPRALSLCALPFPPTPNFALSQLLCRSPWAYLSS
jgi:hypothetical protein